jgi:predicted enzyme related to lactoylglutathione lyase
MGSPVVHWELWSENAPQAAEFYKRVFDWDVKYVQPLDYHIVSTGAGTGINGGIMTPQRTGPWPGKLTMYIDVPDLAAHVKKVRAAGGKIHVERQEVPGMGEMALFEDPDGRVMGLWKQTAPMPQPQAPAQPAARRRAASAPKAKGSRPKARASRRKAKAGRRK